MKNLLIITIISGLCFSMHHRVHDLYFDIEKNEMQIFKTKVDNYIEDQININRIPCFYQDAAADDIWLTD